MKDKLTRYSIARACRWHALACIMPLLLLTGCQEHLPTPNEGEDNTFALRLTVRTGQGEQTRADLPGDPGEDPTLPTPQFVYVWAEPTFADGNKTMMLQRLTPQSAEWTWDNQLGCYRLNALVTFNCGKREMMPNTDIPIYAIASCQDLSGTLIPTDLLQEETTAKSISDLKEMEWDLSAWQMSSDREHSNALRDLYSTPIALESEQQLTTDETGLVNSPGGTVRLYHCAAKVDLKWEVAAYDAQGAKDYDATLALQQQTAVETLTLSGLPTTLKVFAPTENPAGRATCPLLAATGAVEQTTPGNQWIGRAVAYVLQPAVPATIPYSVTFSNPSSATGTVRASVSSQTPEATNTSFTTWFRVNAQIK